jgi:arylsulfatase A-like enzyme
LEGSTVRRLRRLTAIAVLLLGVGVVQLVGPAAGIASHSAPQARTAAVRRVGPGSSSSGSRLNIVFIVSDDERVEGNKVMRNVQQLLARHGVTFSNFDVTTSECGPSRATILTGQYSHHTGVIDNFGPHGYPAFDASSDLAVWLHRRGYTTALVGKYLNDYSLDGHDRIPPGWDDWQAMDSVPLEKYYDYKLNENGRIAHFGGRPDDYSTTVLTKRALDFLRSARRPFFLYFAPVAPHLPAIPAPGDIGKFDGLSPFESPSLNQANFSSEPWAAWHSRSLNRAGISYTDDVRRRQLESLLSLDRSVKEIVGTLARRHLLDRTVIFYTSDNGFLWGEHRLGGKLWPYRESTHVPLIVRTPWKTANRTVNTEPVLNIDFASTISRLARIRPGLPQDGQSFVPMLYGKTIPWRKDYLIEYLGQNKLRDGGPPPYVAIRTPRYLYVKYRGRGWQELYDLRSDPWELRNVASKPAYAGTVLTLRRELNRLYTTPPQRAFT